MIICYRFAVSIQLLFRWNVGIVAPDISSKKFQYNYCFGGTKEDTKALTSYRFQYNYCFGGTRNFSLCASSQISFNTTIVSVEQLLYFYFVLKLKVSIQLLFRWNIQNQYNRAFALLFQYNYCFGGTR